MRSLFPVWLLALLPAAPLHADFPAIDLGIGSNSLDHLGGHITAGWTQGNLYQAVKLSGSSEFLLFSSVEPAETMQSVGYTAGPVFNHSFVFAAVSAGLSVLRFEDRVGPGRPNPGCDDEDWFGCRTVYDTRESYAAGIPIELLVSLKLWYVGVGLRLWATPNLHVPVAGLSTVLFFGGGPTRAASRRNGSPED
jgi:hypothetical protein